MLGTPLHIWAFFVIVTAAALIVDLGVFHRKAHTISTKEALLESAAWISVSLIFNLWVRFALGPQAGLEFLTGYVVEKSLSVDNFFGVLVILEAVRGPAESQPRGLFPGGLCALVMRAAFVLAGV